MEFRNILICDYSIYKLTHIFRHFQLLRINHQKIVYYSLAIFFALSLKINPKVFRDNILLEFLMRTSNLEIIITRTYVRMLEKSTYEGNSSRLKLISFPLKTLNWRFVLFYGEVNNFRKIKGKFYIFSTINI